MRSAALRTLRQSNASTLPVRRFNSSVASKASEAASTAKESAASAANTVKSTAANVAESPQVKFAVDAVKSASETAAENPQVKAAIETAGKAYNSALASAQKVAGPVTSRLGSMLGAYQAPIVNSFKTASSLARQVYIAEKLAPPTSLSTWATAYAKLWAKGSNMSWWMGLGKSGEWAKVGVYGLEAYGIFKIGEMIGRRNLVGYKLQE